VLVRTFQKSKYSDHTFPSNLGKADTTRKKIKHDQEEGLPKVGMCLDSPMILEYFSSQLRETPTFIAGGISAFCHHHVSNQFRLPSNDIDKRLDNRIFVF